MILLKTMLCSGVYYLERGVSDPGTWSRLMRLEFGTVVEPHLPELRQDSLALMYRRAGPRPGRQNCWEFRNCRESRGGGPPSLTGDCPAATECRVDGVHGGRNAGRCCWVVERTRCDGAVQANPEEKRRCCGSCLFIDAVRREEGPHLIVGDDHLVHLIADPAEPAE